MVPRQAEEKIGEANMTANQYKSEMTLEEKAAYARTHGLRAFADIPLAPPKPIYHRRQMKGKEILAFIDKWGVKEFDKLPE